MFVHDRNIKDHFFQTVLPSGDLEIIIIRIRLQPIWIQFVLGCTVKSGNIFLRILFAEKSIDIM